MSSCRHCGGPLITTNGVPGICGLIHAIAQDKRNVKEASQAQGAVVTKALTEQLREIAKSVRAGDCIGTADALDEIVANFEIYAV